MSEIKECQGCGSSTDNALFSVRLSGFCSNSCRIKTLEKANAQLTDKLSDYQQDMAVLAGENEALVKRWAELESWLGDLERGVKFYSFQEIVDKMKEIEGEEV